MEISRDLDVFLKPKSVAVIGATERPGSWGSFMMEGLRSRNYPGKIFPVNRNGGLIFNIPAYKEIEDIEESVDLALLTIPEEFLVEVITACGRKGVKAITIITAGFGEIFENDEGLNKEKAITDLARSYGMRLLGPNVSGTFNLHAGFNASAGPANHLRPTSLGAVCQGGFAFYDLLASGFHRGMGVGKFIHTGNECDLTVTDFLASFGNDPEVKAILMYLETIRDKRRFFETAKAVAKKKPIVVYKAGRTPGSARAARSHTGALSGTKEIFQGLFDQVGIVVSPTMELMLPLGHALLERPPMRGDRVAIITIGGSWGVALADSLEEAGLIIPELGRDLQEKLKALGMPPRASTRNPIDIGAAGMGFTQESLLMIAREIFNSGEIDALILHGLGRPGMISEDDTPTTKLFLEFNKQILRAFNELEKEMDFPIILGSHHSLWESQTVQDLNKEGVRIVNRLDEIAQLLSLMHDYYKKTESGK